MFFFIESIDWKSLQRPKEGFVTELQFTEFWSGNSFSFSKRHGANGFLTDWVSGFSFIEFWFLVSGFSFSKWHGANGFLTDWPKIVSGAV